MFNKKKNRSNYYFDSFGRVSEKASEAMKATCDFLENFDHGKLFENKQNIHKLERDGDMLGHEVTEKLMTEFMTPIDREDIRELLIRIDDIIDAIEEVSLKLYLYDYKELPKDTLPFAHLAEKCVDATNDVMKAFPDFLDKDIMPPLIKKVRDLEEEADQMYEEKIHQLYLETDTMTPQDGFKRHRGEAMYNMLEEITDQCKRTTGYVEMIMYKNI